MLLWEPLNILSYGAGMPSTSLVGMACENAMQGYPVWPHVPVYDAVIFCDLHAEPTWVYEQADFAHRLCERAGILFTRWIWTCMEILSPDLERAELPVFLFGR